MKTTLLVCLLAGFAVRAEEGRVVYDVTEGDGKGLLVRLETIEETRKSMMDAGITPRFVVSFRGPATKLVQTDMSKVDEKDRPYAAKIAAYIAELSKAKGVESIEQCAVAVRHAGTKAENVVPPIKVVSNSFITIAAYESKGYAYIRP